MKEYEVTIEALELWEQLVLVQAKDENEAKKKALQLDGDIVYDECVDAFETTRKIVECKCKNGSEEK